jgi:hypothetical protein
MAEQAETGYEPTVRWVVTEALVLLQVMAVLAEVEYMRQLVMEETAEQQLA